MKTDKIFSKTGLAALAVVGVVAIGAINLGWNGARLDLTENKLYTLSQGSRNILAALEHPVTLRFYFSARQSENSPALRIYARRIQELLEEYAQFGGGNIDLRIINPEPFSEDEDAASAYGLQRVRLRAGGDQLLLGLTGERDGGIAETISFFHPDREQFLEQDISKLIFSAGRGRKPKIGILSSLDVNGGIDLATRRPTPPWASIAQLRKLYDIQNLSSLDTVIPDDTDLLLIIQPGAMPDAMLYAIDQYVLRGGNAMVFADPLNDVASLQTGPGPLPEESESISRLLRNWGVALTRDKVLGDAKHSLTVGRGADQSPIRHLAIMAYGRPNFPHDDIVTRKLETIHFASAGVLEAIAGSGFDFTPLIVSSDRAMPIERSMFEPVPDPARLYEGFQPSGEKYTVAARLGGTFQTAFPGGYTAPEPAADDSAEESETPVTEQSSDGGEAAADHVEHVATAVRAANLIVVADTDILTNRLWVQVQNFFGQQIASPFADNGDFLINAVDNLAGSSDLIDIRGRGRFSRPFEVVEILRREADARFQHKERELLARLQDMESKLDELQQQKGAGEDALNLNQEQVDALDSFQAEKLKIRKDLREVRHQLGSDIESLGSWLKAINIALVPLLLTIGGLWFQVRRKSRTLRV